MGQGKPIFQSVVDLGLRELGVHNEPRRLAALFGKGFAALFVLTTAFVVALCVLITQTDVDASVAVALMTAWIVVMIALGVRAMTRLPLVVVRVDAEGRNQATWLMLLPCLLIIPGALVAGGPLVIPALVLAAVTAAVLLRGRGQVPAALRGLRALLGPDEAVLGDGLGLARGMRNRRQALRLIVATDRRLLVTGLPGEGDSPVHVDAPYSQVSRFGIEWRMRGRVGVLSLTVGSPDVPSDTHAIGSIAPLNLLSIAQALRSHGVEPDDPGAVTDAERAWDEAQRGEAPRRLFDRASMTTRGFDRGLWLLLIPSAATFYLAPASLGLGVLLIVAALCLVSGYLSGTRASLAYIAPLNLLNLPIFLFVETGGVIVFMILMSAVAAVSLLAGVAVRGLTHRPATAPAARGIGFRFIRISSVMVTAMLGLVVIASAFGLEPSTLRLAIDEVTAKQLPVDGRSNLTGNAASLRYTPGPGLHEFVTDEDWGAGPNDGARWELRSSFTKGDNHLSLAHYIFDDPPLDDPAAVAKFVADKDDEHSRLAGSRVGHRTRVVDGRTGYVWRHAGRRGYSHYVAWFPQPVHSVRVECVARTEAERFKRLCEGAIRSLEFH